MTPLIIDWNYILNTALIGFLLVFVVLILMVFIMQAMGKGFKQKQAETAGRQGQTRRRKSCGDNHGPEKSSKAICTTRSRR
ncbi:MAG: OadG family protein [Alistipes putredinis]|nr:MAG: OadG family protein [Alistipes putredinis]